MNGKLQNQIAFYLTGRRADPALQPIDGDRRPALFARCSDLSSLRYDFPLILNRAGSPDEAVLSLSRLVDEAVAAEGGDHDRDRIARHAYRMEREIRRELDANSSGDLAKMWNAAADRLAKDADDKIWDSAKRLWNSFKVNGELVTSGTVLSTRVVGHAWRSVQVSKARAFRERAERLLLKLRDILAAEVVGSPAGRTPERLMAGVGASFAGTFDFNAMSRILVEAKPGVQLSDARRARINGLIDVLERQRFYPIGSDRPEPYNFAFARCSDALEAYQERHEEAVELIKALAIADLETKGDYRETVHDVLFNDFGANGLDAAELAELPDYFVCTDTGTLDITEIGQLVELLAAGLPIKVCVRADDILEPSPVAEGHVALGLRTRQLVDAAIGLTDVFVFQASASHLFKMWDSLIRGLTFDGPGLFAVYSGANDHTGDIPVYLVAAAAMESRAFPAIVYDPSAGKDWASRLKVDDNPSPELDWPTSEFAYEDETLQARTEQLAFTLADFMAMDDRFGQHFAVVPKAGWGEDLISVPEALELDLKGVPDQLPSIMLVDSENRLDRAIVDDRMLAETRRCLTMWHSLQELGGIHNSHAERMLAKERREQEAAAVQHAAITPAAAPSVVPEPVPAAAPAVAAAEPVAEESHGDDPYIETARCTSCNECTNLNNRMFAYNAEKQAYVADPDAGTFRQLVEAAEGCQVSIIHPGKPRNPKEPGLEDLISRAAAFN